MLRHFVKTPFIAQKQPFLVTNRIHLRNNSIRVSTNKDSKIDFNASNNLSYHAAIFLSDLYVIRRSKFDFVTYFYNRYKKSSVEGEIKNLFKTQISKKFELIELENRIRDGGMRIYIKDKTIEDTSTQDTINPISVFEELKNDTKNVAPDSFHLFTKNAFLVEGEPFKEDIMSFFPSRLIKISVFGTDLREEEVFEAFRKYGRIMSIKKGPEESKDTPKPFFVTFQQVNSASVAFNCLYGVYINDSKVCINYVPIVKRNVLIEWINMHTRFVLPIAIAALIAALYAAFEPVRQWYIINKITGRFRFMLKRIAEFFCKMMPNWLAFRIQNMRVMETRALSSPKNLWNIENPHEEKLKQLLESSPDSLILISGPRGVGKMEVVLEALENKKYALEIDAGKLAQASGFTERIEMLASMVGYKPYFASSYQFTLLLDKLLSSTTGQKSGLENTPSSWFTDILDTTALALDTIRFNQITEIKNNINKENKLKNKGKGKLSIYSSKNTSEIGNRSIDTDEESNLSGSSSTIPSSDIPVIVISHFMDPPMEFSEELIKWAARIVTNGSAHVVFTSSNSSIYRDLQQIIPQKSLNMITLGDAPLESSLPYVYNRLRFAKHVDSTTDMIEFSEMHSEALKPIGGRQNDLDYYVQEILRGKTAAESLESAVWRAVTEIKKLSMSFDQPSQSSSKSWTSAQFWYMISNLVENGKIDYNKVRLSTVFDGNDTAILDLQASGLISVLYDYGTPSEILPGRPIYAQAFSKLLDLKVFSSTMQYYYHKECLAIETSKLVKIEKELGELGFFEFQVSHGYEDLQVSTSKKMVDALSSVVTAPVKFLYWIVGSRNSEKVPQEPNFTKFFSPQIQPRIQFLLNKAEGLQKKIDNHNNEMSKTLKYVESQ
ncbi:hypothetical protein BB559_004119 [Furculomyces boomerangus]|uniref:Mitochondrial escape protein 2 n=1 Tax=Furculomyces boomerangus TaxID=61424 RepID=A0A2T9YGN5_9FUNG|nr:hypothetical protein BB559_004119 [Furculomyces boomerangus]